ncbi:lipoprotein N-acyltransferase Lnb domain-containing protein [Flavobacterium ardleyense]|uniref:lipoprotein N-acyltransferase Lnb domain-containing protein n=1 Tax=Flavobacterium ardleyense TaxID=2038737 RepID=UPI00298C111E|nr:DUF4105 domain-containing protein [Flavobacterium ardleyense]
MKICGSQFLLFILLSLFSLPQFQAEELSKNARVSVLTCGTGNEVYALFGHTAIRITDQATNLDIVYNYGAFDFATPNFVGKFAKGDLQYFATSEAFSDFVLQYKYEQRAIVEQELHMTDAQKQSLFDELSRVLVSNEGTYTYKFIDKNCTNMAVDLLNNILGSNVISKRENLNFTYRETLFPFFEGHFFEKLGTSIIFGTKVDQQATLLFLPIELLQSLGTTKISGKPLAEKAEVILAQPNQKPPFSWWNNWVVYLGVLLAILILNKKIISLTFLTLIGFIGLFFVVAGFWSLHGELAYNYNALLLNPLLLLFVALSLNKKTELLKKLTYLLSACFALYFILMLNKIHFWIVLPLFVTIVIIVLRMGLTKKPWILELVHTQLLIALGKKVPY